MPATERLKREQQFHDAQAAERAATFVADPARYRFHDAEYLDHQRWVRPAIERLGPLSGKNVLDWGCGHGMAAVVFARRGARVTACDLSTGYLCEAQERAAANNVRVRCIRADAERLPLASGSFDAVWGHAILHHLDLDRAAAELRRVLRPEGIAILCDPWDGNPLLRWARRWLPYSRHRHTADEKPLSSFHVERLRRQFGTVRIALFPVHPSIPIARYVVLELRP